MLNRSLLLVVFFLCEVFRVAGATAADAPAGSLVIVGGGQVTEEIVTKFVQLAGGEEARLVVIPTASSDTSDEKLETLRELWKDRGINDVSFLHTMDRAKANDPEFSTPLRTATAVWIGGGQQSRLAEAYVGTRVQEELQALLKRGGVIGGTSAGAAIQSGVMIASGNPVPNISRGLDLLPSTIIDQHFLKRNRANRLIDAVTRHPECLGIGIDESTAVVVKNNRAEVVGASYVTLVSMRDGDQPVSIRTLERGDYFEVPDSERDSSNREWAIALHGGAGTVPKDASAEEVAAYREGLRAALSKGKVILESGGKGLDAVEATIKVLEDNPLFNAGRGAVFNSAGGHELDSSIMDGRTLDGGAVAGVTTVRNPIALARLVMDKTRHVLLSGPGAEAFATEQKVDRVKNSWFSTERRRNTWQKVQERENSKETSRFAPAQPWQYGTVGCVVKDIHGNLAAGTSTGGLTNKKFGRVGDSPILGAGTYADNETCAISATGTGEQFIRHTVAAQISQLMRHRGWSMETAAEYVLKERLNKGDGGVIGVDAAGQITWVYTSPGMFRAAADSAGRFDVKIRDEE